jgi:formylglycine-generating enzyme required for sulfatase activity
LDEPGRVGHETQHQVTLTKSMYVSIHEVTQAEWQAVMNWNESSSTGADKPVEQVTWYDAVSYCNQRSSIEGLIAAYTITDPTYDGHHITNATVTWNQDTNGYRLLTEAEWEYTCRATTTSAFYNGAITYPEGCSPLDPNLDLVGWYCGNASTTHDVGGKPANTWGLKDMHGNVWEWCWDWFGEDYGGPATDPTGPTGPTADGRVQLGGCYGIDAGPCRSAYRSYDFPWDKDSIRGLRVCRTGQ